MSRIFAKNSTRRAKRVTDPEGMEALNDIDSFEERQEKKPNRYPKANFETHMKLDSTMREKIKQRAQITQMNFEKSMK